MTVQHHSAKAATILAAVRVAISGQSWFGFAFHAPISKSSVERLVVVG
jgi:hypothetical protein